MPLPPSFVKNIKMKKAEKSKGKAPPVAFGAKKGGKKKKLSLGKIKGLKVKPSGALASKFKPKE